LLLLAGCALAAPPARSTDARVLSVIRALGYVQIDSITFVERAHHLILHSRLDGYEPIQLSMQAERHRSVFEHWTHDASLIRADWLPWWSNRFKASRARYLNDSWMRKRLGRSWSKRVKETMDLLRKSGPMSIRDVHDRMSSRRESRGGWWEWTPHKAALEYLWRTGEVAVHSRRGFEKVYDVSSRIYGRVPGSRRAELHVEWACSEALKRLGAGTPRELAGYLNAVSPTDARAWCERMASAGEIERVLLERMGRPPRPGFARKGWRAAARKVRPDGTPRLLAPFDPLIRDRTRALELFGFSYRFEAFVPSRQRTHGYYTMPVLVGDRLIGRLDLCSKRAARRLVVTRAWLEPGNSTRWGSAAMREAANRLALQLKLETEWRAQVVQST
jgi:hypothetical protein